MNTRLTIRSRLLVTAASGLALAVASLVPGPAATAAAVARPDAPQAAAATAPAWGLLAGLLRVAVQDDAAAAALGIAERAALESLRPSDAEVEQMLAAGVALVQAPVVQYRAYRPQYQYQVPGYTGYQTMQDTVNAAVGYWTGGQPRRPSPPSPPRPSRPSRRPTYAGDPYGFTSWLNGVRAQYGLGAVSYDPNLSAWANMNNAQQNSRGLGHFVMGPARRQNSAMGNFATIGAPVAGLAGPRRRAARPEHPRHRHRRHGRLLDVQRLLMRTPRRPVAPHDRSGP